MGGGRGERSTGEEGRRKAAIRGGFGLMSPIRVAFHAEVAAQIGATSLPTAARVVVSSAAAACAFYVEIYREREREGERGVRRKSTTFLFLRFLFPFSPFSSQNAHTHTHTHSHIPAYTQSSIMAARPCALLCAALLALSASGVAGECSLSGLFADSNPLSSGLYYEAKQSGRRSSAGGRDRAGERLRQGERR